MEKEKNINEEIDETLSEEISDETVQEKTEPSENTAESDKDQGEDNLDNKESTPKKEIEKRSKKKFSKKKDKKDQQIEELEEKYQRLFAEFQNYRSRSEKEKKSMFEVGAKSIIEKILPVVDNLERGISALSEDDLDSPVGQGMSLINKQMASALEEMGIEAIETEGKEFDPELHNAVMHEDNDELGDNMIALELQKGYTYRNVVIRHSMVKVAN